MPHPIDRVQWIEVSQLRANDYNPNVVFNKELDLLEFSLFVNGWIQPILTTQDFIIIDGFHRYSLAKRSKKLIDKYGTKVPVVILELSEAERMLLTIRINRAKGSHVALKMSEIVKKLIELGLSVKNIMDGIGATKDEIDLLLMDDVFQALDIQNHKYSKAWYPK